ncbi:hypothetical protein BH10PSE6_BH10PSE6_34490 [soil metagenome]
MLLIHRSRRAANAVWTVSPRGELFVASVVLCMILAVFGDAVDPTLFGEAEFALFDLGGESAILAMRHWSLLELLLAGGFVAAGIGALRILASAVVKALRPAPPRPIDKVPI